MEVASLDHIVVAVDPLMAAGQRTLIGRDCDRRPIIRSW